MPKISVVAVEIELKLSIDVVSADGGVVSEELTVKLVLMLVLSLKLERLPALSRTRSRSR